MLLSSRCAFVSNLSKTSKSPVLQPTHRSMRRALEGDLCMNVFRDGRWGVFRHQLISQGKGPHFHGNMPV